MQPRSPDTEAENLYERKPLMSENISRLELGGRQFIILGTAHVSRESVDEVQRVITEEKPDRVCVEIDASRYSSMSKKDDWSSLNIYNVIRQDKGFLLLGNLVLASFQRRLGMNLGVQPGEEMMKAVETAESLGIPYSFSDREIQITLKRAWKKTGLWGKSKLLSALFSAVFSTEKLSPDQIEELKKKGELESMMEELAAYLPSVKKVLIDERDTFIASNIFASQEDRVLAVVGAGHVPGIVRRLTEMSQAGAPADTSEITALPKPSLAVQIAGFLIPVLIAALIGYELYHVGVHSALQMLWKWALLNGGFAAIGSLLALAHPVTIAASIIAAPIATITPVITVGMLTGMIEAWLRKPRVQDLEKLHSDITSFRGFFRNRFTHILLVFVLSTIGGIVGNAIAVPYLITMLTL